MKRASRVAIAALVCLATGAPAGAVTTEIEPNGSPEEATHLGSDLALDGTFQGQRDLDHFSFAVGPGHLWRLEFDGEGLTELTLYEPGGTILTSARASGSSLRLPNLGLAAGRYIVQLKGNEGRYRFRVTDQGPRPDDDPAPVPGAPGTGAGSKVGEIEPNDTPGRAMSLDFGDRRTGLLQPARDEDVYRITLDGRVRFRLVLEPADQALRIRLHGTWGPNLTELARIDVPAGDDQPDPTVWEGELAPGDYLVTVGARGATHAPYALMLEHVAHFAPRSDVEPNNLAAAPAPFPADGVLRGSLTGDSDFYRMPVHDTEIVYTLTARVPDALPRRLRVNLHRVPKPPPPEAWQAPKFRATKTVKHIGDGSWQVTVPAGTQTVLELRGDGGTYEIAVAGPDARPPVPEVEAILELDAVAVAAFDRRTQTVAGRVRLRNPADRDVAVDLATHVGHARWSVALDAARVTLGAGAETTVPLSLRIAPDAPDRGPVHIAVAALSDGRVAASAEAAIVVAADAPAVAPGAVWTLPEALLGGLNVAWSALGATVPDRRESLIDGSAAAQATLKLSSRLIAERDLVIDLAGDEAVEITGVILHQSQGGSAPDELLRRFRIEVSADGETFRPVLTAELGRLPGPQAHVLPLPVVASHVRLVPLSSWAPDGFARSVTLGELQVIARPGTGLDGEPRPNLADPRRGGHVVRTRPYLDLADILTADRTGPRWRAPTGGWRAAPQVVLGFREGRAALVEAIRFHWADGSESRARPVLIEISTESPLGPWTAEPVPRMLSAERATEFVFDQPVWVRYLRLGFPPRRADETIALPDRISVVETAAVPDGYRSILAEWTDAGPEAVREWLAPGAAPRAAPADAGDTMGDATPLELGGQARGTVQLGRDEDWYALRVPEPGGTVTLSLSDTPSVAPVFRLIDQSGHEVPVIARRRAPGLLSARIWLAPGRYFVRILEPPRTMAIAWDTSGSVTAHIDQIQNGIRGFSRDLRAGRDEANFLPFADSPAFLLEKWTGARATAAAALAGYDRREMKSSNAELAMLTASRALAERDGVRAILVVTDLQSSGAALTTELWKSFGKSFPRVFAVAVPSAGPADAPRKLRETFRDWTMTGGGHLADLTGQSSIALAFRRAAAWLRRPSAYQLEIAFEPHPPAPARLSVTAGADSVAALRAVEIILDGSGSMLKRIDGRRRYRLARDALLDLTETVLPEGVPFALRIFGKGGEGSCRTDLELPLAPLDRAAVRAAIEGFRPVNLARTPIAASLAAAAADLDEAGRDPVIVVLTDGEETCDGDPAAEIANLRQLGFGVQVNIVGFALDDDDLKARFRAWAEAGDGSYFDAASGDALATALRAATRARFKVVRAGEVVAAGTVNGPAVELPSGSYEVVVGSGEAERRWEVFLENGGAHELMLN